MCDPVCKMSVGSGIDKILNFSEFFSYCCGPRQSADESECYESKHYAQFDTTGEAKFFSALSLLRASFIELN